MIGFSTRSSFRMFISSWWVSSNDGGLIWFWNSGSILSWLSFVIGKPSFLKWNRISLFLRRSLYMVFLPLSSGVFRLSLAGSSPGIPCRRSFGFQGSIGVLLVAYHTFKRIFRTWQVRFWGRKAEVIVPVSCCKPLEKLYHIVNFVFRNW